MRAWRRWPVTDNFDSGVDGTTARWAPGEVGELWLLGPQVALGYYNDSGAHRAELPPNPLNPACG